MEDGLRSTATFIVQKAADDVSRFPQAAVTSQRLTATSKATSIPALFKNLLLAICQYSLYVKIMQFSMSSEVTCKDAAKQVGLQICE